MTQVPQTITTSSAAGNELLQRLLQEGVLTRDSTKDDLLRYRQLLQVLFTNCVLIPCRHQLSAAAIEQAGYIFAIINRQIKARPDLLTCCAADGSTNSQLFKWLLPRLISVASQLVQHAETESLAEDTCQTAAGTLAALSRDVPEQPGTSIKGQRSGLVALDQLVQFCLASGDTSEHALFSFHLPSSSLVRLLLLEIVCRAGVPFADSVYAQAARALSNIHPDGTLVEVRYTHTLIAAIDTPLSVLALHRTSSWTIRPEYSWREIVRRVVRTSASRTNQTMQLELWWTIQSRIHTLHFDDDFDLIGILFTPIMPRISASIILMLLADEISRWKSESHMSTVSRQERFFVLLHDLETSDCSMFGNTIPSPSTVISRLSPSLPFSHDELANLMVSLKQASIPGQDLGTIVCEMASCASRLSHRKVLPVTAIDVYVASKEQVSDAEGLKHLACICKHMSSAALAEALQLPSGRDVMTRVRRGLRSQYRKMRLVAGHVLALFYAAQSHATDHRIGLKNRSEARQLLVSLLPRSIGYCETAILTIGATCRLAPEGDLGPLLEILLGQLGVKNSPIRSLAYTELSNIAKHFGKSPYTLLSPHLERVSVLLAISQNLRPEIVTETMHFIGYSRQNFFDLTMQYSTPALVLSRNQAALDALANVVKKPLGQILLDNVPYILTKAFLDPSRSDSSLVFLVNTLRHITAGTVDVSVTDLMNTCIVPFLVSLIVELGDDCEQVRANAADALLRAKQYHHASTDLGDFVTPHMLGVISHLNDTLHDVRGKKSVQEKRKIIRSLGELIDLVGQSMSAFSPQIMASLQSTLRVAPLRAETLQTWRRFIKTLKFADIGPFVGRTMGALVNAWRDLGALERPIAIDTLNFIADNVDHLTTYIDEMVSLDHIPELKAAAARLNTSRRSWDTRQHLSKLLDRVASKNVAIASTSMGELRTLLKRHDVVKLSQGDTFDPIISRLLRNLLEAVTRDIDAEHLKATACECLGMLGALDPDRMVPLEEPPSMTIMKNFSDPDEAVEFAMALIRDHLVDAFRATTDTKHQNHLAFAIQELLKFCGFTTKVLDGGAALRIRSKWMTLPKDQIDTLAPLLGSRFSLTDSLFKSYDHPIFGSAPTYREWLQWWTSDLIHEVMSMPGEDRATRDSQAIFGVFRGVLRIQDVSVAHHVLPHLVLHVLLSGTPEARAEICDEIHAVLQAQVNPSGSPDKRMLSARVIFDLMDHLSRYLRLARRDRKTDHPKIVESVLSNIETELMANAALQSKAYARALRSFEQRIVTLERQRSTLDLQAYFERLHQIYAELDEPDGMEGVSAFVISPSLEHQIREHEMTGRWTAAQSCWEVRLQQQPDDIVSHVGLLKCLKSLGHYDTLRTHIRGVLSRRPAWRKELAPFEAEAAWISGDWATITDVGEAVPPVAKTLFAAHAESRNLDSVLLEARHQISKGITTVDYNQAYESVLQLHHLYEIESIVKTNADIEALPESPNREIIARRKSHDLHVGLDQRFDTILPAFRVREATLTVRRAAYRLVGQLSLTSRIGPTWITSSKIARKAGYSQTAYSAILQAHEAEAPFAYVQQAKLLHDQGDILKAFTLLRNMRDSILKHSVIDLTTDGFEQDLSRSKAVLLEARWAIETDRFDPNEIISLHQSAATLAHNFESPYYYLGRYYDGLAGTPDQIATFNHQTCHYFAQALRYGVKFIYRTMPRMLTIWLDLGETKDLKKHESILKELGKITAVLDKARSDLPAYQFYTAFPQIISRIVHPNKDVQTVLVKLIGLVIETFPHQALWPFVGLMQSNRSERQVACKRVLNRIQTRGSSAMHMIREAERLSSILLRLADDQGEDKKRELTTSVDFPYVKGAFPSAMIMPLQDALTCGLPTGPVLIHAHNPFLATRVEIINLEDKIEVMPSMQKPKKLVFIGSDGKRYPFLCKPHDDLRKDARLMDFNSMINKLLKGASESRRRRLYIRTYAVMPLNEECGLLEWVSNTNALKSILEKGYASKGQRIYTSELHKMLETSRAQGPAMQIRVFKEKVIPMYTPTVFYEWFLTTWPEPSAWLTSRMAYARTLAVMSMIGFVLGQVLLNCRELMTSLGDRHGENILFDGLTGDTVHVDLNCLFDKGKTFQIPERVPFRLTHNMVNALGVTGVEGVFRKAAEITLNLLRTHHESLMSVLEAFVHDPLVEWAKSSRAKTDKDIRLSADRNLRPIKAKLTGVVDERVVSVANQVDRLIKQATDPANLALMYQGWAPWL
nr:serine/threonine-protein kinase [Naematelia aurantialba]